MEVKSEDASIPPVPKRIGIVCNTKHGTGDTPDAEAEYDNLETVDALRAALESEGHQAVFLEANETLPESLKENSVDLVFNIAEGIRGRGREAEVPGLLNLLGIPFTGSDETALSIALDKALCKRLLSTYGIRTPAFAVIRKMADAENTALAYPVIVKPNAEGSSKGVSEVCVVKNKSEFLSLVQKDLELYHQELLAEEFVCGREFTVGILGNGADARAFPPMEIQYKGNTQRDYQVYSFDVKKDYTKFVKYACPAPISDKRNREMCEAALTAFHALGCHDFCRVDFRMDMDGNPYFIEMNPLPGLAPGYSDFPMLTGFCGMSYTETVLGVLHAALARLSGEGAK